MEGRYEQKTISTMARTIPRGYRDLCRYSARASRICPYGEVRMTKFVGEGYDDFEYTDFNGNKFANESDWYYNKRILELGVKY